MAKQVQPITEHQLDLITRAHGDTGGLIEPLLTLKGGAKLKMITSLAQRGLIAQREGQWRITPAAIALVTGSTPDAQEAVSVTETPAADPMGQYDIPTFLETKASPAGETFVLDPNTEAALTAQEAQWQAEKQALSGDVTGRRANSKQAQVIAMLQRPEGATIAQIGEVTAWQAHTTRGFFAGTVKKKLGLTIVSEKIDSPAGTPGASQRIYRIIEAAAA